MASRKSIRDRERYANDPEYRARKQGSIRRYVAAHKDEINARRRERLRTDPEYREKQRAYRRHGLTPDDYYVLLRGQNGACAICKRCDRPLGVDHCHSTKQVRALLCSKCNLGLGQFGDNAVLLLEAIAFLEASRRGIDDLADGAAAAAEIAERMRHRLEAVLRAAFSLRAGVLDIHRRIEKRAPKLRWPKATRGKSPLPPKKSALPPKKGRK